MRDVADEELTATRNLLWFLWLAFPGTPLTYLWGYLPTRERAERALAGDDPRHGQLARYDRIARGALRFWLAVMMALVVVGVALALLSL